MKRYRKLVSLVLTVLMVLALLPASLSAQETGTEAAASGESGLPEQYIAVEPQLEGASEPATGAIDAIDLSEMHLLAGGTKGPKRFSWYDTSPTNNRVLGGNTIMSLAALTRWDDPVNETDYPYPTSGFTDSQINPNLKANTQLYSKDVVMLPKKSSYTDNTAIKKYIMLYGAAYASLWWDGAYEDYTKGTYYYPASATRYEGAGGHAITVVGWDDNYAASNFAGSYTKATPPGNGAYIIKNSWGTSAGNNGYYYVSYYDWFLGMPTSTSYYNSDNLTFFLAGDSANSYSKAFSNDDYGAVASASYTRNSDWLLYANKFTGASSAAISAVSFYTYSFSDQYKVWLIPLASKASALPSQTSLLATASNASGTAYEPGYHTITLSNAFSVKASQSFAVIVAVSNPTSKVVSVPLEINSGTFLQRATFGQNESLFLYPGQDSLWLDLGAIYNFKDGPDYYFGTPANVCIRAYAASSVPSGTAAEPVLGGSNLNPGESDPTLGDSTLSPGVSNTAPGDSTLSPGTSSPAPDDSTLSPGTSGPAPGDSTLSPGTSSSAPGESLVNTQNGIGTEALANHRLSDPFTATEEPSDTEPLTGGTRNTVGGAIPAPYDYFNGRTIGDMEEIETGGTLPARYNLKELGLVTSVKNQGDFGSCWTFATMASLESNYLKKTGADIKASVYLRATSGSSLVLSANAANPDTVSSYTWSIISGSTSVSITANSATCTVSYKTGGAETAADIKCVVTYDNSSTNTKTFRIAVANYGSGDGSAAHPFEVSTPMGLQLIDCFSGTASQGLNFIQKNDITLTENWHPIGDANNPFLGTFDGGSFAIKGFKLITLFTFEPAGLFGYVNNGTIKNVILHNAAVDVNYDRYLGGCYVGGIAGRTQNSTIQDCAVSGNYTFALSQENTVPNVGGLIGDAKDTIVTHCSFSGKIEKTTGEITIGGLIGNANGATVSKSFANLYASGGASSNFGGLAGFTDITSFTDCYATGTFNTPDDTSSVSAGGITRQVDKNCSFTNCYVSFNYEGFTNSNARKGAIAAWRRDAPPKLSNCYYNKTSAGDGVILETFTSTPKGLTAQQMKNQKSFTGFNFSSVWVMVPGQNNSMPALQRPLGSLQNPLVPPITFSILNFNHNIYVTETSTVEGFFTPEFIWPRPINLVETENSCVKSDGNGSVTGIKRGNTKLSIVADGKSVLTGISFSVYDKKGDLDHNGTSDYLDSVKALIAFLTGKATPTEDACWLLDANNSCGDAFTATTENLSLTDLLMMQQASAGIRNLNSAG